MSEVSTHERQALVAVARLFGDLLLHELDERSLAGLRAPDTRDALSALGVDVPPPSDDEAALVDHLAAGFFETFVQPKSGGPLVHSLWSGGTYEGEAAASIRRAADAAGLDYDRDSTRGANVDHLGVILHLWAAATDGGRAPDVSAFLAEHHLEWAKAPLAHAARGEGFYPSLARATHALIGELTAP